MLRMKLCNVLITLEVSNYQESGKFFGQLHLQINYGIRFV